jgi:hypothetical protein
MKNHGIKQIQASVDDTSLEYYMEVDTSMRNPFDIFFSDKELEILRDYAAFFLKVWRE